jgi:hypothetical protein
MSDFDLVPTVCDKCGDAGELQGIEYQRPSHHAGTTYPDASAPKIKMQVCSGCWWRLMTTMWGSD